MLLARYFLKRHADELGVRVTGFSEDAVRSLHLHRARIRPEDFLKGILYTSDQAHYSVAKGAILAGFPEGNVRSIPTDSLFRLRPDALEARIEEDRARGLTPFLAVASAGTTNTGAVDPLPEPARSSFRAGPPGQPEAAP